MALGAATGAGVRSSGAGAGASRASVGPSISTGAIGALGVGGNGKRAGGADGVGSAGCAGIAATLSSARDERGGVAVARRFRSDAGGLPGAGDPCVRTGAGVIGRSFGVRVGASAAGRPGWAAVLVALAQGAWS